MRHEIDRKKGRTTFQERQDSVWWDLSHELFGDAWGDINDFELTDYRYFLDNVGSLEDLKRGLYELSPLADDALSVAEVMNNLDFAVFKLSLVQERESSRFQLQQQSTMPKKFLALVAPSKFIPLRRKPRA